MTKEADIKISNTENTLLRWLVVILMTGIIGLVIFLYQDLRSADKEQFDHQSTSDKENIDKFSIISSQLITLNANLNQVCIATKANCTIINNPGVSIK